MSISKGYKKLVNECNKKKIDTFIPNYDVEHAIYLTELLIRKTKNGGEIDLFSGHLFEPIYADKRVINAIKDAAKRNVKIRIILECPTKKDMIFFKENYLNY